MKKILLACFHCGLAISLAGWQGAARAQHIEPDFSQIERLTELRPCRRMEKEFQPILSEIEKGRQKEGIGTRLLWADLYNTGYCTALPVPLTELGQLSLERFPREIPFGFRAVNWNPIQQDTDWSLPYKSGGISLWDDVWSLVTLYYDKKNKRLYWMEYRYSEELLSTFQMWGVNKQGGLEETDGSLYKIHYRNLLDDLAAMAKAGQRDRVLVWQVYSMRGYLTELADNAKTYSHNLEHLEFLDAEHKRRGALMDFLEEEIKAAKEEGIAFGKGKPVSAWTKAINRVSPRIRAWRQAKEAEAEEMWARNRNPTDFAHFERVSAQHKSCKRMDKAFQPAFQRIEKRRRETNEYARSEVSERLYAQVYEFDEISKTQILWLDDGRDTGYCRAIAVPLTEHHQRLLKRFPKEFPEGLNSVYWDPMRRMPVEGGSDTDRVTELYSTYYDNKNKNYHRMPYLLLDGVDGRYPSYGDYDEILLPFVIETPPKFLERHYRSLLDDLAETAKAGQRDNLLILQILQMQMTLQNKYKADAFLEAERKRRGALMRLLDGVQIEDLERDNWTYPDVCTEAADSARWWPCNKPKGAD